MKSFGATRKGRIILYAYYIFRRRKSRAIEALKAGIFYLNNMIVKYAYTKLADRDNYSGSGYYYLYFIGSC
jgi:hypothetical protein